jgi:hypothetical protein
MAKVKISLCESDILANARVIFFDYGKKLWL